MPPKDHAGHRVTYEDQGRPVGATDPHHDTVTCRTCGVRIPEEEN
jgi:YD repeat-containing protein